MSKDDTIHIANNTNLLEYNDLAYLDGGRLYPGLYIAYDGLTYPSDCGGTECMAKCLDVFESRRSLLEGRIMVCQNDACQAFWVGRYDWDKLVNNHSKYGCSWPILDMNLERNRCARERAIQAALCLIAIRQFRKSYAGLLGYVPMDIIKIIAGMIISSYTDDSWLPLQHRLRKRRK